MAPRSTPGLHSAGSPKKKSSKSKRKASDEATSKIPGGSDGQASKKPRSTSEVPAAASGRPTRAKAGQGGRVSQLEKLGDILDGQRRSSQATRMGPTSIGQDVPINPLAPEAPRKRGGRKPKNALPPPNTSPPDNATFQEAPAFVENQGGRFGFFAQSADHNPVHIAPPGIEPNLQVLNNPYITAASEVRRSNNHDDLVPQLSSQHSHTASQSSYQPPSHRPLHHSQASSQSTSIPLDPALMSQAAGNDSDSDSSSTSSDQEGDESGEGCEKDSDLAGADEEFGWAESHGRRGEDPGFSFAQQDLPQASQILRGRSPSPQFEFQYSRSEDEVTLEKTISSSVQHDPQAHNAQVPAPDGNQDAERSMGRSNTSQVSGQFSASSLTNFVPSQARTSSAPVDVLQRHHKKNGGPRLPNPVTLDRLRHAAEDKTATAVRSPAVNNDGPKPTQLSWYTGPWKQVLEVAKSDCHAVHALENAFPNRVQDVPGPISNVLATAINNWTRKEGQLPEGIYPEHKYHMAILLYEDLSTWRSDLKKIARGIAPPAYGLIPPPQVPAQEHHSWVENVAAELIHDSVFLRGGLDENGKTRNFAHPALRDAAIAFFYTGTYRIARKQPDVFRLQLPLPCLAMVGAAYNCILDGFARNGSGKSFPKFSAQAYGSIYRGMLDLLHVLLNDPYHGRRLEQQLREWAEVGWAENIKIDGQDPDDARKHGHLRLKLD